MQIGDILKLLQSLGLSPLEILTVIALVIVYRKNEQLYQEVKTLEGSLDKCLDTVKVKQAESH